MEQKLPFFSDTDDIQKRNHLPFLWGYVFIFNLIIVLLTFGLFFQQKFACDTYVHITLRSVSMVHIGTGRPFAALIVYFTELMGLRDGLDQWVFASFLMLSMALCTTILTRTCNSYLPKPSLSRILLINVASLISLVNVFFVSWFMFTEASILIGTGLLITVFAVIEITKGKITAARTIVSLLLLTLGINSYQVFVSSYIVFACTILLVRHGIKLTRRLIYDILIVLAVVVAGIAMNLVLTDVTCAIFKVSQTARAATFQVSSILSNINQIIHLQPSLWYDGFTLMPPVVMIIFLGVLVLTLLVILVLRKNQVLLSILICGVVLLGSYISVFAPHFVSATFWPAERTLFPLFSIFSMLMVLIAFLADQAVLVKAITLAGAVFLMISAVRVQFIASDQLITNTLDHAYADELNREITTYEAASGVQVTKISVINDSAPTYGYYDYIDNIIYDTNISARAVPWAVVQMISYYTNRVFTQVDMPQDVFDAHFSGKNWDCFVPEEQIVFVGDTVYMAAY